MERREIEGCSVLVSSWPWEPARPTLVFIHGAGQTGLFWRSQLDAFGGVANTVALDLPGHGESAGPALKSVDEQAHALASWLRAARVPDPIPVGLSMGGAITQRLLLDEPGLCRTAARLSTGARLRVTHAILWAVENDFATYVSAIEAAAVSQACREDLGDIFADMARQDPEVVLADFLACDAFDVREDLGRVEVPVVVIGGNDDLLTPPKIVGELAELLPGVRRVELPDTGHLPPAERPNEVNAELAALIEAAPAAGRSA